MDREKVFPDVLDKKKAFKDYKSNCVQKTDKKNFFKGVSPSFWSKISDYSNFNFFAKID